MTRPRMQRRPIDEAHAAALQQLEERLDAAQPGQAVTYYLGDLAGAVGSLDPYACAVQALVWQMHKDGALALAQRRMPVGFQYLAVKRS